MEKWYSVPNAAAFKDALAVGAVVIPRLLPELITFKPLSDPIPADQSQSTPSPSIVSLVKQAEATLWSELPLCAIARAHKKRAEELMNMESPGEEVYVEYYKYLRLYPFRDDPEYVSVEGYGRVFIANAHIREKFSKGCIY